jgi:hypothetical protein
MELLLEADADPLAGSPSALDTARFFGKEELARQLLQRMKPNRMRLEAIPTFQTVSLA